MRYSEIAYPVLRILDLIDEYKESIPQNLYTEVVREGSIILNKLMETYNARERSL